MESKLILKDATFSYGKREIFSNLNLEVSSGDIFCLLGPNGCGKTTLLRCLSGALKLKKGSVWLDGEEISSLGTKEIACLVGFVFQEHRSSLPYSVLDLVLMGRAPHLGMFSTPAEKDTEIAERALELVGISHLRDKRCTHISGGERQLALIARTLAQETEVILLDEPTSHLDFKNQTLVLRMITRLAKQGLTIIMSSHFPNHAFLCSNRVAMMEGGRFIAIGRPEDAVTETNLKVTYGIDKVRIYSVKDPESGEVIRFCTPSN